MCVQQRLRLAWAFAQSDQSSLSAWRKLQSLAIHWAHSEKKKRKVQGVPKSQTAALPRYQEEEETKKKQKKQAQIEQTYEKH